MEQTQFSMKQKLIAIILIFCFMVTLIPEFAVASYASTVADETILSEEDVTKEDIIEKTETTTTYDLGGDQKMTVMHGGSVRYKNEDGDLVDYDPSLLKIEKGDTTTQDQSLLGYSYTNKDGDKKHYLPQRLSEDTPIRMEYQDYAIEFSLTEKSLEQTGMQKDTVQVEKDKVQTAYEDFAKLPVKAVYGDVNEHAVLTYTSTEDGVKETWTFNEKPDSNVIQYRLNLTGMTARKNITDGGITYYDRETGDIIGAIASPWMNDATGNAYSENIQYELDIVNAEKGEYLLTMTVDEEYLNDESRVYPITIDPTNTWRGDSEVKDVYVISGSKYGDTNFYESGTTKMPSGKNDTGTHRTYIKFINLKTITKGYSVGSAKFTVYETGTGASKQSIGAYRVTESWTTSKLTYNNRPTSSTCYDTITTQKTAKTAHTFDLTKFAKAVANETITNYGIQLYNKTSDPSYACFHGSRASSYKPKLVVTYYSVPTKASSVSLSASATKKSSNIKLTFSGITGDAAVTKKYKIQKYSTDTWKDTSYSGTATSGMSLPSLADGTYRVAVWGVNKAGVSGSKAYSGKLLVDSVAPSLASVSLSPTTSDTNFTTNRTPTIAWNATDTNFANVKIYLDGNVIKTITTSGAQSYTISKETLNTSGKHTIKVSVSDKAGNTKSSSDHSYYLDVDNPTGSITVTEQGTGKEIDILKDTVNICAQIDDLGSGIQSAKLELYRLAKTTDAEGKENLCEDGLAVKTIFENATISTNRDLSTTEETGTLKNGNYRFRLSVIDKVGNETAVNKDVRIENPIQAPQITAKAVKESPIKIHWKFPDSIDVKALQYKIVGESEWTEVADSAKTEGSFEINTEKEDSFDIMFRGVDTQGVNGNSVTKTCVVDGTSPTVKITSFYQGTLKGTVTDKNLQQWKVSYKEQGEDDESYVELLNGNLPCEDEKLGFIDLSKWNSDRDYTLKLEATDVVGNSEEDTCEIYVPSEDQIAKEYQPSFHIKRSSWDNYDTDTFTVKSKIKKLELTALDEYDLRDQDVSWYIDNQKVSNKLTYEDDFASKYETGENHRIFVINQDRDGKRTYSKTVTRNGALKNIDFLAENALDGTVEKEIKLETDIVSFRMDANDSTLAGKKLTYQMKLDTEDWVEIESGRNYYIADLSESMAYVDNFQLRAIVEEESGKPEIGTMQFAFDTVEEEYFCLSEMDNYVPESVAVKDKLNYKTYLFWDNVLPEEDETISYEVYRGTDKNFEPSKENLAAMNLRAGYFREINVNYGGTFYYKIRAVRKNDDGKIIDASSYSKCVGSTVIDGDEYTKRMGLKDYWKYAQVETPIGTIAVEKSAGNLVYQQKDAEIPNEQLLIEMTRSYNSLSSAKSAFGLGWTHDFDMELLSVCEEDSVDFQNVVLKDGSGTIYHFIKQSNGKYISSLGKYIIMEKEEKIEELHLPEKTVGVAASERKKIVAISSSYTLKTKDNMEYRFNSGGQMVYQGEPNGNFLLFEYDDHIGLLKKVTTSKNIAVELEYTSDDYEADELLVKKMILPDGTALQYHYKEAKKSSNHLLTEVTEVSAKTESEYSSLSYCYEYDNEDRLTVIRDAKGNAYTVAYSEDGKNATAITYPNSDESIALTYHGNNSTTTEKLVKGQVASKETDTFNYYGNCVSSVDAEGYKTTYTYQDNLLHTTSSEVDGRYLDDAGYVRHPKNKDVKIEKTEYDEEENPIQDVEEDGTTTNYEYCGGKDAITDDLVKTEKEIDGEGNLVLDETYQYDANGNVTESYDAVSGTLIRTTYFNKDDAAAGQVKGEVESEKEYAVLEDGKEKLLSTTTYQYEYDAEGNKKDTTVQVIDGDTIKSVSITDVLGREIYTSDRGKVDTHTYDGFGRLIETTSKETGDDGKTIASSVTSKYDENGSLVVEVDEEGLETHYSYDEMNRLVKQWQVKEGTVLNVEKTSYSYEDVDIYTGAETKTIKNAFVTTVKTLNPSGGLLGSNVTAEEKTYQNALGQTVREVKNGIITDATYDGQDNIVTRFEVGQFADISEGMLTVYLYDADGNQIATIQNPVYDMEEGTFRVDEDATIVERASYDSNGNKIAETDGEGHVTNYQYDAEGNLIEVESADGSKITYAYDVEQEDGTTATVMTDANGNQSITKTDDSDRIVSVSDLGKEGETTPITTSYEYDKKDNVTKETDSEGNYKCYHYDGRDRLKQVGFFEKDGTETLRTTYTYDLTDNITSMADYKVDGTTVTLYRYTKYAYDKQKRLIGYAECAGSDALDSDGAENIAVINRNQITFCYDNNDNLTEICYPDRSCEVRGLVFQYNEGTQWLEKVYAKDKSGSAKLLREYTYTSDNKVRSIKDHRDFFGGSGGYTYRKYTYDAFDRPVRIEYYEDTESGTPKEVYTYEFDKNNNIVKETLWNDYPSDEDKVNETRTYTFDILDQLIRTEIIDQTDQTVKTIQYAYDEVGNRIKEENDTLVTEYTYNALNQMTSSIESRKEEEEDVTNEDAISEIMYSYDKNGNRIEESDSISGESKEMTYDADNRLKTFTKKKDESVIFTQANQYNGEGKRIQKVETDLVDTKTINYFYQNDAVLYTTDAEAITTAFNIMGNESNIIASARDVGASEEAYYFYNKDIRESTTNLLDVAGESVVSYEYSDYGETTINGNIEFYNEVCYTGGVYDRSTELYYLNARYYDPEDAVFLTQDTYRGEASDPSSLNLYAYCANNPVTYTDPSGHFPIGAAIGAAWGAYDGYKYAKRKNLRGWRKAGAIAGGAVLGVVNPFKKAGKAYKGAKRVSRIVSKSRVSKKVARSIRKVIKPTRIKRKIRRQKIKTVHAAQRAKCKITKKGCFVAGTKIAVKNGFLPIEKIKAGDRVWSEDMRTGKKTLQKVKKIFVREKDSIVRLSINGEVTETTDEHPFFVKDIGWIPAGQLQLGDKVKLGSDDYAVIDGYEVVSLDEPIKVYNFEVAENHNYYVSKIKVLVHNGYEKKGRFGKQKRLREIANDPKVSKTIRNEMNTFYKQKKRYKVPEGYELAHNKGKEAYKGYGYEHTRLQLKANHRNEHKFYKPWMKKRRKKR